MLEENDFDNICHEDLDYYAQGSALEFRLAANP